MLVENSGCGGRHNDDWTHSLIEPIEPLDILFVQISMLKKPFVMRFTSA